jgi:hypothetical protein
MQREKPGTPERLKLPVTGLKSQTLCRPGRTYHTHVPDDIPEHLASTRGHKYFFVTLPHSLRLFVRMTKLEAAS